MIAIALRRRAHIRATRGFTLTELAIVLGIIGIILGSIWTAAAMVYENNHVKQATQQILTIAGNWKSTYGGKRVDVADATDLTPATIDNNFAPADMVVPATAGPPPVAASLQGPWTNSGVTVLANKTGNYIKIQYTGLTRSACGRFANAALLSGSNLLVWAQINASGARSFPPLGVDTSYTTTDIDAQCVAGNANTVTVGLSM